MRVRFVAVNGSPFDEAVLIVSRARLSNRCGHLCRAGRLRLPQLEAATTTTTTTTMTTTTYYYYYYYDDDGDNDVGLLRRRLRLR